MRKICAVLLAAVLLVVVAGATEARAQAVRLGVKGGFLWSELSGDEEDLGVGLDRRTGWTGGAYFVLGGGGVTVQVEGLYARRGAELVDPGLGGEAKLTLDYLEVPVLLKVSSQRLRFSPHLFVGPYGAFQIDSKTELQADGETVGEDISDDIEEVDYGVVVGAGMEFGSLGLEARYTLGLRDLFVAEDAPGELKHRALAILASLTF